jgi:hypothetical protein
MLLLEILPKTAKKPAPIEIYLQVEPIKDILK